MRVVTVLLGKILRNSDVLHFLNSEFRISINFLFFGVCDLLQYVCLVHVYCDEVAKKRVSIRFIDLKLIIVEYLDFFCI